jgi:STE24 endopeptidase
VILTDRLIEQLTPEEIEAVFGHEVGHIKHHHLLFYFGFLMASLIAVFGVWELVMDLCDQSAVQAFVQQHLPALADWLASYAMLSVLPLMALLCVYVVVVFGYLSRRCERQADIQGCRTVSVPVFVAALEKVAQLNGIDREHPGWLQSWQHATIAQRVAFLEKMHAEPEVEPRFQRRVGMVKWAMVIALVVVIAMLGTANLRAVLGH